MAVRRGAGAVERGSLENCWPFTGPVSSNLTPAVQPRQPASSGAPRHLDDRSVPGEICVAAPRRPGRPDGRRADRRLVHFRCRSAAASPASDHAAHADAPDGDRPPVTVPPVTTPVVTTPAVTTPTVPLPPQAPPAPRVPNVTPPALPPPPSLPQSGLRDLRGSAESTGESNQGGRAETSREQASRLRLARDWIAHRGADGERRTTLVFILRRPALVEFVVLQVAPDCRRVGRFRVRGHRGVNRVRVPTRVGREPLAPGTYRVVARAVPAGRTVGRARLVVVDRASRGEIRAARRADSCAQGSSVGTSDPARPPAGALSVPARPKSAPHPVRHHGVLGARFAKGAFSAAEDVPLWVYVLLALAIALLGAAASLPKTETVGLSASLLLGLVGATILLGLTITYAFG